MNWMAITKRTRARPTYGAGQFSGSSLRLVGIRTTSIIAGGTLAGKQCDNVERFN